MLTVAKH